MNITNPIQTSQAEVFFRSLSDDLAAAFAQLSELVQEKAEENEWTDFKEAAFIDAPLPPSNKDSGRPRAKEQGKRGEDVKRLWSENLSAFANSSGGVLIWGIRTEKEKASGIDKAESLSLAADAPLLAARLRQLQNEMVDPPVQGVEIRAVTEAPNSTEGFVVCFIPGSIFKPHRAMRAEKEYYFRVGDSNRTIPTGMLRAVFYPTFIPWLVPQCSISLVRGASISSLMIQVGVRLSNRGMASAQNVFVSIESVFPSCSTQAYPYSEAWDRREFSGDGFTCRRSIHPDETITLLSNLAGNGLQEPPHNDAVFRISFKIFAHNAPGLFSEVTFTGEELSASLSSGNLQREGTARLLASKL